MRLHPPRRLAVVALLALPLFPTICVAEIYGWIDPNGVVTFSNLPPPGGVDVTQVIHEEPMSAKAVAEAAQRAKEAETAAQNDRVRLREWELSRSTRAALDYPVAPTPAAAPGDWECGPNGYEDCNDLYLWWPWGYGPRHGWRYGYRGHGVGVPGPSGRGRPPAPSRHASAQSSTGSGHSR